MRDNLYVQLIVLSSAERTRVTQRCAEALGSLIPDLGVIDRDLQRMAGQLTNPLVRRELSVKRKQVESQRPMDYPQALQQRRHLEVICILESLAEHSEDNDGPIEVLALTDTLIAAAFFYRREQLEIPWADPPPPLYYWINQMVNLHAPPRPSHPARALEL